MTAWTIIDAPQEEVRSGELGRRLRRFNYAVVGEYLDSQPVWLSARDPDDRMVGGLRGYVFLYWLHIDVLWVDETLRAAGLGSELLAQAEAKAKALGAHSAKLDTFEWQARDFYAKRGYREFGRIDNHTDGYYLAFMMKKL
ncbi:GNAT family N-acetyltransferase [Variovorax saccharolyticus]|uniref:GNAT family N-acetyltransferase n=1 Tax=Variovorax saccharolyticus TaxID=3053516 RepID=UPI0025785C2B|nr:GNAT family N-acetyltransferase [Variovorax sp. J22R187]MDM0021056.1 GNAT family N-acetyltransferase [Variovorax sp. J22R187]